MKNVKIITVGVVLVALLSLFLFDNLFKSKEPKLEITGKPQISAAGAREYPLSNKGILRIESGEGSAMITDANGNVVMRFSGGPLNADGTRDGALYIVKGGGFLPGIEKNFPGNFAEIFGIKDPKKFLSKQ